MRSRRWVLFLVLLVTAITAFLWYSWQELNPNEKLRQYLLTEIRAVVDGECEISRVRLSIGTIHFMGVRLFSEDQHFSVYIKDLRLGYSLTNALLRGFDPYVFSQDIILENPQFTLYHKKSRNGTKNQSPFVFPRDYEKQLTHLQLLKRFSIVKGELYFKDEWQNKTRLAHSIQGWVISLPEDTLSFQLSGNFYSSNTEDLVIRGKADMQSGRLLYAHAKLENYPLNGPALFLSNQQFQFLKGVANGHATLSRRQADQAFPFSLNGELSVRNGAGTAIDGKLRITDLNMHAELKDWNLLIKKAGLNINNSPLKFSGRIRNILSPDFQIKFSGNNMRLAGILNPFDTPFRQPGGRFALHATLSGQLPHLQVNARVNAGRLQIYRNVMKNLSFSVAYYRNQLSVSHYSANWMHQHLNGHLDIDFNERFMDGFIEAKGDVLPYLKKISTDSLKKCNFWLSAEIGGKLEDPAVFGQAGFSLTHAHDDSMSLKTAFALKDKWASLTNVDKNSGPQINGRIYLHKTNPRFDLNIFNFHRIAAMLWNYPYEKVLSRQSKIHLLFSGEPRLFQMQADIKRIQGSFYETDFCTLHAVFERKDGYRVDGDFQLMPNEHDTMNGHFRAQKNALGFFIQDFRIEDNLQFSFAQKDTDSGSHFSGKLDVTNFNINRFLSQPDTSCYGWIDAHVDIHSPNGRPAANGFVALHDFYCRQGGPYFSKAVFSADPNGFVLENFIFNTSENTLIDASGRYSAQNDSLSFGIKGAGFDLSTLSSALSQTPDVISGKTLVDVKLSGTLQHPDIRGILAIKEGRFYKVPFDELELRLGNGDNGFYAAQPAVVMNKIRFKRKGHFECHGHGVLPLRTNDSLLVQLQGKGNFLSLASDFESYFKQSNSKGKLQIKMEGTLKEPRLVNASLSFTDADMEFGSVIPGISKVKGDIEFEPENRFLHIKTLQGKMGKEWFRISNTLSRPGLSERRLENMDLGNSAINLGIFVLETRDKGIPLNIRGLMEKGVFGYLRLGGKKPGEDFYLAGPIERPVIRGKIHVHDFQFMYPFDNIDSSDDNVVVQFLRQLEWDLVVVPENDVRYVTTLEGALDKVYLNLQIDEQFGDLEFTGQINDESFIIEGQARSSTGIIEYFDMTFRLQRAGVEFDRGSVYPVVYGEAHTTVTDSMGMPSNVMLTLLTVDQTMEQKSVDDLVKQEHSRARWDQIRFKLTSDNPNLGSNEAQILASLGYSTETLQDKAFDAIGISTENILFRPLYRPIEKRLENILNLDYVRFSSRFTRNLIEANLYENTFLNKRLSLLRSSKLIVGKYLATRLFLQYTGQIEAGIDYKYNERNVGLSHTLGLEYRIKPQLWLELEYDYNSLMYENRDDKRILLRHWFPF